MATMAARPGVYPRQLFAAVTFASIPVYCYGGIHHFGVCVVYATAGIIIAVMLVGAALWALNQHWASGRGGLGHDQPSRPRVNDVVHQRVRRGILTIAREAHGEASSATCASTWN